MPARLSVVAFVPAGALLVHDPSAEQSASAALDVVSRAAGLVNQLETLRLPPPPALAAASGAQQQQLLSSRHSRAHLLCLLPAAAPTAAGDVTSRAAQYAASLQQHAALLLLLLVSNAALLLLPSGTVPASLLQLLQVLGQVHAHLAAEGGDGDDRSSSLAHLLRSKQQPTQLHIGLQLPAAPPQDATGTQLNSWSAAAASAAVGAAEQALLKSKAVRLAPAAAGRGPPSSGGELVQLAGVHCCCSDGGPDTVPARRRAVLRSIQRQLSQCDQASSSSVRHAPAKPKTATAVPVDAMPSAEQLLSAVAAAAAGAQQHATEGVSVASLPELWQQLLALLFPLAAVDASGSSSSSSSSSSAATADPFSLFAAATMGIPAGGINAAALADEDDTLPSDGSWGEAAVGSEEQGWDEVQQHDEPQHSQQQRGLQQQQQQQQYGQTPGELLATAVDREFVSSLRRCHIAARRALRAYLQAVPKRYTAAVHDRVLAAVLQQYGTAARGPAQQQVQQLLEDACDDLWHADCQLCPVLSLTGHGCSLAPHDASVQQHSSCFRPRIHTPDGAAAAAVAVDWFDVEAANVVPARLLLQEQQQGGSGKQQQRTKYGSKSHKQQQQASGQLLHVVAQLSAGSSSHTTANTISSSSSSSRGTATDASQSHQEQQASGLSSLSNSTAAGQAELGPWMSLWQLGECDADAALQGPDWVLGFDRMLQLRVAGQQQAAAGGRDAAKAQGAPKQQQQQQHTTLAAQLKRSKALGGQAAAAAGRFSSSPILGPLDFPTLEQAVGTTKRQAAAAARKAAGGSHEAAASMQASSITAGQQQLLMAAWAAMLHEGTRSGAAAADRGHRGGHGAAAGPAGRLGGRPRHGQHAAAGPVAQPGPAEAAATAAERPTLATLWIALEYESLTGQRVILQPQQLLALEQQQHAGGGFGPQPDDRLRRGKGASQQQQHHVAAAPSAGGPEGSALEAAVQQLLSADLPLHLHPLQLQLPHSSKKATASAAGSSSGVVDPQVLQLQRIYIKTPAAPLAFATRPTIAFSAAGASGRCIEFACEQPPQQLPPGQLSVINLPKMYAAPAAWATQLRQTATAAAAARGGTQQQQQQPEMVPLVPVQPGVCHGSQAGGTAGGWCACLRRGSWLFPAAAS